MLEILLMDDGTGATRKGDHSPRSRQVVSVVLVALVAETGVLVFAAQSIVPIGLVAFAHVAIVGLMALLLNKPIRSGSDGGLALLAVIGTMATGPFGAFGALLMPWLARRNPASEALLPAWYERIALSAEQDAFTRLSDRVAIGRTANLAAPLPKPFVELFRSGPLSEQQSALGMIARSFHPGYLPVLKTALDSPEPVIRVQAAAVAARVRGELETQVGALVSRASDPTLSVGDAMDVTDELRAAVESGLLEASTQASAQRILDGLLARTFARIDVLKMQSASHARSDLSRDLIDTAYATHLLEQERFEEFRALRLSARRPILGRYRRRLVRSRAISPSLHKSLRPLVLRR